jgi:2,5-furandicarboxylate decarboxylase 1
MSDLRNFLQKLDALGQLLQINDPVSPKHEVAALLHALTGETAVIFKQVQGHSNSVVGGVCGTRERIYQALNAQNHQFHTILDAAINHPTRAQIVSDGAVQAIKNDPRLSHIPVLTHYHGDPGPYITSGVIYAHSPDREMQNASIHRLQVLDENHLAIRIVPRHLYHLCQLAKEAGQKTLDISISLGLHPAILVAAASPAPWGVCEWDVANTLLKGELKLIKCPRIDAYAPSNAELILEGQLLLNKEVTEGPFVDLTSTFDIQRKQYPIKIVGVLSREQYQYQALLPAGTEHILLMGMPQETRIYNYTRHVNPTVKSVNMTLGGKGWLHCVVSFDKYNDGDGKNILMAIFAANPSIKHAIVVDSDINVYNMEEVEWALATRFRGDKDLLVISNVRVSSLDPTADQIGGSGCKVGFDATCPFSKPKPKFKKAEIPISQTVKEILYRQGLT